MDSLDRASLATYGARIGMSLVGFLATVYFARELGAAGLGIYFTFEAVVQVFGVLARAGIDNGLVKRVSEGGEDRGRFLGAAILCSAVPLFLVSVLVLGFGGRVDAYVGLAAAAPLAVLALATGSSQWVLIGALRGERRIVAAAGIEFANVLVRVLVSVALLLAGYGVLGLALGLVVGRALSALVALVLTNVRARMPTRETVRSLLDFSKYTAGMSVASLAYGWTDTLLIALLLTSADVGVYEAAWRVSAVVLLAAQSIGVSLAPAVSGWHSDGDLDRVEDALSGSLTYALVLVVPAVAGVAVLGDAFMRVVYRFETGGLILLLLVGEKLLQAPKQVTQSTLFGVDRPDVVFWTNAATLAANVGLNLLLIPRYGLYGAAVATAATSASAALLQLGFLGLRGPVSVRFDGRALGWQALAATVMGGAVYAASTVVPPADELRLGLLVAVGVAVYGLVVLGHDGMRDRVLGVVTGS